MEYFLEDVLSELVEAAYPLRIKKRTEFEEGVLHGYYVAVMKLLNQAEAFGISKNLPSKWQDYSPEELLSTPDS